MIVPEGTQEYQDSLKKAKAYLIRLNNGSNMLKEAIENQEMLKAQKLINLWGKVANELFTELEIATLIHQHNLTGNNVLVKADGGLIKIEDLLKREQVDMDPWSLLSLEKLKTIFGEKILDFVEFVDDI